MNKLYTLENMGFKMTWELIAIGLFGKDEIQPLITNLDVFEYLDGLLKNINKNTDDIIALISEKDNPEKFDKLLICFAKRDAADTAIQKRKWRAYLLKKLMDSISKDCLQGLLELMEFWVSMGLPSDCPETFPTAENKKSVQDYFTQASYEASVKKNQDWLDKEIQSIVALERKET